MGEAAEIPEVGPYRCHTRLAAGAGGEVWQADGPRGAAAVKIARTTSQREALRREGELLDQMDHPYMVRRLDADPEGAWLAMELVEGPDVLSWAAERSGPEIIELGACVAEALVHLHGRGVVHGDLKPDNVLVAGDKPRLIDLGIARTDSDEAAAGFQGTPGYAAPELYARQERSPASDVYALGALLYRLLTGQAPFVADDPKALAWLPLQSLPEPPSSLSPHITRELEVLLLSMLARTPERRPPAVTLPARLRAARAGTAPRVVVGMNPVREPLRRAVVSLSEGRGGVFVLHGASGCGRKVLIREAVDAARREGLGVIQRPRPGLDLLQTVTRTRVPSVVPLDGAQETALEVARAVLVQGLPVLCLVRASQPLLPLARLGARHLSPPALQPGEVARLMRLYRYDPAQAEALQRATRGLPGAVTGQLRRGGPVALSAPERRLLAAAAGQPAPIPELARSLELSEHELVDLAEPLLDRGLLVELEDGASLMTAREVQD